MEQHATDETHLRCRQQVEVAAEEYQQIEQICAALLARADDHGVFSLDRAEIIAAIHSYGAAARAYHAALIDAIRFLNSMQHEQEVARECQRMVRQIRSLERQFKDYLLRLDNLVIAFRDFVQQSTQ